MHAEHPTPPPELDPETAQRIAGVRTECGAGIAAILATQGKPNEAVIADAAVAAAKAGDMLAFESHFDALLTAMGPLTVKLAATCLAGMTAGSERAFDFLESLIQGEKQNTIDAMHTKPEGFALWPTRAYGSGTGLVNLYDHCIGSDIPPNAWIDKAATNPMHRWTLYMDYYQLVGHHASAEQKAMHAPSINTWAAELAETHKFQGTFVRAAAPEALLMADDPVTRATVLNAVLEEIQDNPYDSPQEDFAWLSRAIVAYVSSIQPLRPGQEYDPTLSWAYDIFGLAIERIQGSDQPEDTNGFYQLETLSNYLSAQTAFAYYATRSPGEFISSMRVFLDNLLEAAPDLAYQLHAMDDRNKRQYTSIFAQAENFGAARMLINAMNADATKCDALIDCYGIAKKLADLEALGLRGLLIDAEKAPRLDRIAAQARVSDDPTTIAAALETISLEEGGDNAMHYAYIERLGKQLLSLNPQLAIPAIRAALAILRDKQSGYIHHEELSMVLINAGDTDEASHAYSYIMQSRMSDTNRLYALQDLGEAITRNFPGLPEVHSAQSGSGEQIRRANDPVIRALLGLLGTMKDRN